MKTDVSDYIGKWVAICSGKIIAHGKKVKEVLNEAKNKCPDKRPLMARIPDKEAMIFWHILIKMAMILFKLQQVL